MGKQTDKNHPDMNSSDSAPVLSGAARPPAGAGTGGSLAFRLRSAGRGPAELSPYPSPGLLYAPVCEYLSSPKRLKLRRFNKGFVRADEEDTLIFFQSSRAMMYETLQWPKDDFLRCQKGFEIFYFLRCYWHSLTVSCNAS